MSIIAHRRAFRLNGMLRLFCVLVLAAGPSLAAHAAANLTLSITTWNAGSRGVANVANPGDDFAPSTITRATTYTAQYRSANVATRTYYFRVNKNADEATTWNGYFEVWICPMSETGAGTTFNWTVPIGTWVQVPSTGEQEIVSFRLARNSTETITFSIELRNITTRSGPGSPFRTTVNYRVY
jgi:hypothetical protein